MDDIIVLPESKTLEFKRDLSSPDGVLKTLIAFANTAGGRIIIGIEDKTRLIRGVDEPLSFEERLTSLITDNILPQLVPSIEVIPYRNVYLISIEVYPSNNKPHYLKRKGRSGGAYVRVGSSNRVADAALLQELERYSRFETYDAMPMPELSEKDIDFDLALTCFSPYRKLKKTDLETLKLVATHQGKNVPTVGGILLFGKNRLSSFPDAWIQAGRFSGVNKAHITDVLEIVTIPSIAVVDAIQFVEKHVTRAFVVGKNQRQEILSFPMVSIREAIINAVVHADYAQRGSPIRISIFDDRVEISNPGLILAGLTLDDLLRGVSKLRNPVIGRVFYELKLVERWGSGIARMIDACRSQGFVDPFFEETGNGFKVIFSIEKRAQLKHKVELNEKDALIIRLIETNEAMTTRSIAEKMKMSTRAARVRLLKLKQMGLIIEAGVSINDPRKVYKLAK